MYNETRQEFDLKIRNPALAARPFRTFHPSVAPFDHGAAAAFFAPDIALHFGVSISFRNRAFTFAQAYSPRNHCGSEARCSLARFVHTWIRVLWNEAWLHECCWERSPSRSCYAWYCENWRANFPTFAISGRADLYSKRRRNVFAIANSQRSSGRGRSIFSEMRILFDGFDHFRNGKKKTRASRKQSTALSHSQFPLLVTCDLWHSRAHPHSFRHVSRVQKAKPGLSFQTAIQSASQLFSKKKKAKIFCSMKRQLQKKSIRIRVT